jgi:hypothetical protein
MLCAHGSQLPHCESSFDRCAGLGPRLELSATWRRTLVADGSGDLLDAVICGLQAAHAAFLPGYGLPADLDPLEGWIAAVPPPASRAATASGS